MIVMHEMTEEEQKLLENQLHDFDEEKTHLKFDKTISFGFYDEDVLVAGVKGKIEGYKMMYIDILFVAEKYRKMGFGKSLMKLVEERALLEGVKTIRLDTFSWQGRNFYLSIGYSEIASYEIDNEVYEYFLMKRL